MGPPHRGGTFSPSPAQSLVTASNHSPHGSSSAGPSPSTNSPTATSSGTVNRITVAQVYVLLSSIKEGDHQKAEQLRKLIDEQGGMEVFQKYFSRLVVNNAPQIFPGVSSRSAVPKTGSYQILVEEMRKISRDPEQAGKIADAIETANDDIFQDFNLSTFMDHFKLDALEKVILALAFKTGTRPNLKAKADAILSTNYAAFLNILSGPPASDHGDLSPEFVATILDRYLQGPPPTFDDNARNNLFYAAQARFSHVVDDPKDLSRPGLVGAVEVLATLSLAWLINDQYPLTMNIYQVGASYTSDEEICVNFLRKLSSASITEEQVGNALLYAAISRTQVYSVEVLVAALRKVTKEVHREFSWQRVVVSWDRPDVRVTPSQFLSLFKALLPIAQEDSNFDIQQLWGGRMWDNSETQLSFIRAFCQQHSDQFDFSSIPGFQQSFAMEDFAGFPSDIIERAAVAVRHPLVSTLAVTAVIHTAFANEQAQSTFEASRLLREAILPNLDIFVVSVLAVPTPWPELAQDNIRSLFFRFLWQNDPNWKFVVYTLWRRNKIWVVQSLMTVHVQKPMEIEEILERVYSVGWLDELVQLLTGFGLDLAALAHSKNKLNLDQWARNHAQHSVELHNALLTFLRIKADHEIAYQRAKTDPDIPNAQRQSIQLPVKTIFALLNILVDISSKPPAQDLVAVQRLCLTAYPRLINYGQGYDVIIDDNGLVSNSLPPAAIRKMEEHYKKMYAHEIEVRDVVNYLASYKQSVDPSDQDIFACMIHGLFDEYPLYHTYPLEALATTAVLFGAIIAHKLISDLPLEIGLGMILEAVSGYTQDQPMYKFGLQALHQLSGRFREWPGFCKAVLQLPGLGGSDPWRKADEVARDHDAEMERNANGNGNANGAMEVMVHPAEPTHPPFASINVEPSKYADSYEEPSGDAQEKVVFVLNNTTESNLETKFKELKEVVEDKYHGWFAGHLVEERAKMQPNYLHIYLDLLRLFDSKSLNYEVQRSTYNSVIRLLNAESTLQSSIERGHLKNLAGWLGSLTVAQDKPILHRNIAFKQLLIEAYDTQRLVVVIPFVCKVLVQGASSTVFKPPNPWLMNIVHLLVELYHTAELKLNLKFEIEVLCKGLSLDHKGIEPSTDIQTRVLPVDEPLEPITMDVMDDRFNSIGIGGTASNGRFSPHDIVSTVPDLAPLLTYPPPNDMVNQQGLREIVSAAITRAVHEIISPVVERSVTIAAISTAQMIRKDFATELDEEKVRAAAISMVKRTAGSLALVTSKEPLRASMNNYIRQMQTQVNQGLPEGTIIMCVNSNLDMACAQVEKKAEEKAVPEIEEMIEPDLELRRQHKLTRPNDFFWDQSLSRWGMTIPEPFKLEPNNQGLNTQQMAIYEEFARAPPRMTVAPVPGPAITEVNKPMQMDSFDGQFNSVSNLPTPGESILVNQQQHYPQRPAGLTNGRSNGQHLDPRTIVDHIQKSLNELFRLTAEAPEQKYEDIPHSHPIKDAIDRIIQIIITSRDTSSAYTAETVCQALFSPREQGDELSNLSIESSVHLLEQLCKMQPHTTGRFVSRFILRQPDERIMNVPLVLALLGTDFGLLEWQRVDLAASKAILADKEGAIEFLRSLMDRALFNERPIALRTDVIRSLDALSQKLAENPDLECGREIMLKLEDSRFSASLTHGNDAGSSARQEQMEYVFEEWLRLCNNPHSSKVALAAIVAQIHRKHIIGNPEDSVFFFRLCIELSVDRFEHVMSGHGGTIHEAYMFIDGLGRLIARLVVCQGDRYDAMVKSSKSAYLKATLAVVVLVLNHHHVMRGENFNQKVFFRLFSTILNELSRLSDAPPTGLGCISPERRAENILVFPQILLTLQPLYFPGFICGWLALISHRAFLPPLLSLPDKAGWDHFLDLLECYFQFLGELLNPLRISPIARQFYKAILKLFVVLHHDFPDFLVENHLRLTAAIPTQCIQLQNTVLATKPSYVHSIPNPLDGALKIEQLEEIRESPIVRTDAESALRDANVLELLNRALKSGPGEPLLAPIAHAIQQPSGRRTTVGYAPINVDTALINALVLFVGQYSIRRASLEGGPTFISGTSDAALLSMLSKELKPEARYYFIIAIVNHLRFPCSHTYYFSLALLDLFGTDQNDHEEAEVREQIIRVMTERLSAKDSNQQPWGLIVTLLELVKNPKYIDVCGQLIDFYPLAAH